MARLICEIAAEIQTLWNVPKTHIVRPYLIAMHRLKTMRDFNGIDTPKDILATFIQCSNAFVGEDAKRIKDEIRELIATVPRTCKSSPGLVMESQYDANQARAAANKLAAENPAAA